MRRRGIGWRMACFVLLLFMAPCAMAQQGQTFTVSFKANTLEEVFDYLSKNSDYVFTYTAEDAFGTAADPVIYTIHVTEYMLTLDVAETEISVEGAKNIALPEAAVVSSVDTALVATVTVKSAPSGSIPPVGIGQASVSDSLKSGASPIRTSPFFDRKSGVPEVAPAASR